MNHFELDEDLNVGQYIFRTQVEEVDQASLLSEVFGSMLSRYETHMTEWLAALTHRTLDIGYQGGQWSYFRLDNLGLYKCVTYPTYLTVWEPVGDYCVVLSSDAACVVANVYAMADLATEYPEGPFKGLHAALMEYARQHKENKRMLYMLDKPLPPDFSLQQLR